MSIRVLREEKRRNRGGTGEEQGRNKGGTRENQREKKILSNKAPLKLP